MRVFCTGIPGAGATDYIKKVAQYGHSKGQEIKVFNVGQEVFDLAKESGFPITPAGVLDLNKRSIHYLTSAVYQKIAREITDYEHCIVDAHIHFRWRGAVTDAVTPRMVEWLNPDAYVTMMDLARPILKRLYSPKKDNEQWKSECEKGNLNIENILDLQNYEVNTTEQWASAYKKPMYVLPSNDSVDSLYKISTRPDVEIAYASFPITHLKEDKDSQQKIDQFVEELRRFKNLAVISPHSVKLPEKPSDIENQHTVMQDLEWFVEKSTKRIFVYFPKKVYSRGVDHESIKAKESCKEVWFIAPEDMNDPFTNSTIHQRFYSHEECIRKILESGMEQE